MILFANLLPGLYQLAATGGTCTPKGSLLGFPTWYKYLVGVTAAGPVDGVSTCVVRITSVNDTWLIIAAVIEILLRIAALAAVGFIIFGGIQFVTAEGQPDKAKKAIGTVINACVGLTIAIVSTAAVTFVAGRF